MPYLGDPTIPLTAVPHPKLSSAGKVGRIFSPRAGGDASEKCAQ